MQKPPSITIWGMLVSRSVLFFVVQALIALGYVLAGNANAWDESSRWWILFTIPANLTSVYLLARMYRREGKHWLEPMRFSARTVKTDLLWMFLSSFIGLPSAMLPMGYLAVFLFGDSMVPVNLLFKPIPTWALVVGILFPLTIGFAELPTYFGYVMPRLAEKLKSEWAAWLICSVFLALQHIFLPFIPDGRYLLWRMGMFIPFSLFAGLLLKLRPGLLPYASIVHTLMDFSTLSVYLSL